MANSFGFNPMFAGQSCPTCGCGPAMGAWQGQWGGQGMNPYFGFTGGFPGSAGYPFSFVAAQGMPYGYGWTGMAPGNPWNWGPTFNPWFGGTPTWGGTFPGMYGAAGGLAEAWLNDDQISDMIYDSIDSDPSVPFDSDINVDVTAGIVTLTGTVPNKRIKHSVGDDAWWVPGVIDVNNNLQVLSRRGRTTTTGKATTRRTETTRRAEPSGHPVTHHAGTYQAGPHMEGAAPLRETKLSRQKKQTRETKKK